MRHRNHMGIRNPTRAILCALFLPMLARAGQPPQPPAGQAGAPPAQPAAQPGAQKVQGGQGKLAPALAEQSGADKAASASQAKIDQLADQKQDMAGKYRQALADTESLKKYNEQLAVQVKSQTERIADMNRQLVDIEATQRNALPLMQRMVDTVEQFVALDVPFLIEERTRRVQNLKQMMARADVSTSEKYRRILEAYQIEMEYGRTLEAYEGKLGEGDQAKTVQFVRIGRVVLMYQTPDGRETGYWDASEKKWVEDGGYTHEAREAIRVAKKQGAPDLLWAPVSAPVSAEAPKKEVKP